MGLSDLTGRHFSWPLVETWWEWESHQDPAHYRPPRLVYKQATVIYTGVVLYDHDDDYWWVYLWDQEIPGHQYRHAYIRGARIRPWIREYERLNHV